MCNITCMQGIIGRINFIFSINSQIQFLGYKFPDGTLMMSLHCKGGKWILDRLDVAEVPECLRNEKFH